MSTLNFLYFLQHISSSYCQSSAELGKERAELSITKNSWSVLAGVAKWAPAWDPKVHRFNSQLGNMPGLQARSPVRGMQKATNRCLSPSLSPSPPLSLRINNTFKQNKKSPVRPPVSLHEESLHNRPRPCLKILLTTILSISLTYCRAPQHSKGVYCGNHSKLGHWWGDKSIIKSVEITAVFLRIYNCYGIKLGIFKDKFL